MARRRKQPDIIDIAPAIGALFLLATIHPQVRSALTTIASLTVWLLIFCTFFLLSLAVWCVFKKANHDDPIDLGGSAPADPPGHDNRSLANAKPSISEQLRAIDWFQFEKLIALAYAGTGTVIEKGGANPDGGIDLIVVRHGEATGVQCKHWKSWTVGVKVVREMIGAMADAKLKKGVIVTLNPYTQDAIELAGRHNIELVDEQGVVEMIKPLDQQQVQSILSDTKKICPKCEREMVLRTATKGINAGGQFWGCSGYPRCKFVMQSVGLATSHCSIQRFRELG